MRKKSISITKKMIGIVLSTMMVVSAVAYQGVVNAEPAPNTPIALSTPLAVNDTFTANIENNGVVNLPCTFMVTKVANNGTLGEVQIGDIRSAAIDSSTTGTITIPNTISDASGETYTVTRIKDHAFWACAGLTSTGLENNNSVTSIGELAFTGCTGLTSTGLEKNTTVTSFDSCAFTSCTGLTSTGLEKNTTITNIGSGTFQSCTGLTSTGLESNTTVTTIGSIAFDKCTRLTSTGLASNSTVRNVDFGAFQECTGLTSTGLENNTTVTNIGDGAFSGCTSLGNVIFKITTLPTINNSNNGIFKNTNANVYYLPETTNPEQLTNCGAVSINELAITSMAVKTKPKEVYIVGQSFDPTGLVVTPTYNAGISEDISYDDTTKTNFSFDKTTLAMGDTEVKITYLGKEVSLPITVEARKMTGIEVKTASTKVEYIEDQTFNPEGLVLTTTYNDGTKEEVIYNDTTKDDFTFDKTKLALGDTGVTVTYKDQTTIMPITVVAKKVTEVKVETKATKDKYIEGESFDPSGLVLTVTYEDNTTKEIGYNDTTKADFSFDKTVLAVGDTEVTITYMGQTTKLEVTVEAKAVIDPTDPSKPVEPNNPDNTNGTTNGTISGTTNSTDQTVVTNDNTTNISEMVVLLLATGLMSVLLMKKKKEIIE